MNPWKAFGIAVGMAICSATLITSVVYVIATYGIKKGWWKE